MSIYIGLPLLVFQSTLPHGSDVSVLPNLPPKAEYFNPRSLTGATLHHAQTSIEL